MKRLLLILFIIMIVLSGCTNPAVHHEDAKQNVSSTVNSGSLFDFAQPLTLAQVTTAMMLEGLPFTENRKENPDDYAINGVTPTIYTIKQNQNVLMIYIFESIALRQEACGNSEGAGYWIADKLPQNDEWLTVAYTAKNALIIDRINIEKYQSDIAKILSPLRTAADSLNETKEMVFADQSSHWDAKYFVRYYQYWYQDSSGKIHICQYAHGRWLVKYLDSDAKSIHHLNYQYTLPDGNGSGNIHGPGILDKKVGDYYFQLGNSVGRSIPNQDDVYTLTIQWDGNKETLHLKMIDQE